MDIVVRLKKSLLTYVIETEFGGSFQAEWHKQSLRILI